jgi:cell division protein FtsL
MKVILLFCLILTSIYIVYILYRLRRKKMVIS